jgi:hypothetical protein
MLVMLVRILAECSHASAHDRLAVEKDTLCSDYMIDSSPTTRHDRKEKIE